MRHALLLAVLLLVTPTAHADHHVTADDPAGPVIERLMHTLLEGVDGTEVVVSRVALPPNSTLPRHWHPGEEFAYVVKGSVTLWMEGEDEITFTAGEIGKVPLRKVHTAITKDEGCELIVFRVHEAGAPERVLVDEGR